VIFAALSSAQGHRQKNFQGGQQKKQDRKIAPLSLSLVYQYHVWKKSRGAMPSTPADAHGSGTLKCERALRTSN